MTQDDHYLKKELYDLVQKDPLIFDFLQSGSLDGIWYWDLDNSEHEWMSPQFWLTLGYEPETKKHLAIEWQDLINPDDLQTALENFQKHCADPNYPYDQIVRYRHKDGSTVWVRCRGIAIRDDSGKPIRMLGAHTEITEQKMAEEALQEFNEYLNVLFHSTLSGILVIDAETHVITDLNETAEEIFEIPRKDIIGRECHKFVCPAEKGKCPIGDLGMTIDKSERTLVAAGGEEKTILKTVKPLMIKGREYYIESFIDITRLKKAEEELRKSEQLFRSAIENSPIPIAVTSGDRKEILAINNQFTLLFGYGLDEIRDASQWWKLAFPDDKYREEIRTAWKNEIESVKNGKRESGGIEGTITCKDNSRREVIAQIAIIDDVNFISVYDLTERKKQEQEREDLINELQEAIARIKVLDGLVPICANCKKIRDDKGYWNHLESYIEKHSDASFSHGICQDCAEKIYGKSRVKKGSNKQE